MCVRVRARVQMRIRTFALEHSGTYTSRGTFTYTTNTHTQKHAYIRHAQLRLQHMQSASDCRPKGQIVPSLSSLHTSSFTHTYTNAHILHIYKTLTYGCAAYQYSPPDLSRIDQSYSAHLASAMFACYRTQPTRTASWSVHVARQKSWHIHSAAAYAAVYVAVRCCELKCVAVCCSVLYCAAIGQWHTRLGILRVAVCCSVLQCVAVCYSALPLGSGVRGCVF